jgi:hypothetical protein
MDVVKRGCCLVLILLCIGVGTQLVLASDSKSADTELGETPMASGDIANEEEKSPISDSQADLAKAAQNPIANMISLPFQYNANFGIGPDNETMHLLNIQPVYPVKFGEWVLVNRTIIPVIYLPDIAGAGSEFGLGDINHTTFFVPPNEGKFMFGFGPTITFPSATDDKLGSEKWSAGPAAIALYMTGPWVMGGLINNQWSFAGDSDRDDVNKMLINPFLNYNLPKGWYLSSAPIITADWEADSDQRWIVPVGGGLGKILKIGNQPINVSARVYYNVEHPDEGANWQAQLQVQLLFPK